MEILGHFQELTTLTDVHEGQTNQHNKHISNSLENGKNVFYNKYYSPLNFRVPL